MEITLNNYTDKLRKLYYTDGKEKWFTYYPIRNFIIALAILFIIALYFLFYAVIKDEYVVAAVMMSFSFLLFLIFVIQKLIKYYKWKKSVETYIKWFHRFKDCKLVLNDNSFELLSNEESHIEKWENIKSVNIYPDYISIIEKSETVSYVFPADSMSQSDFELLCEKVRSKTK